MCAAFLLTMIERLICEPWRPAAAATATAAVVVVVVVALLKIVLVVKEEGEMATATEVKGLQRIWKARKRARGATTTTSSW